MINLTIAILCIIIFIRLFTFQRNGARFRRGISIAAAAIMASSAIAAVFIFSGRLYLPDTSWPIAVILAFQAYAIITSKGNLAEVLDWNRRKWNGVDRRAEEK